MAVNPTPPDDANLSPTFLESFQQEKLLEEKRFRKMLLLLGFLSFLQLAVVVCIFLFITRSQDGQDPAGPEGSRSGFDATMLATMLAEIDKSSDLKSRLGLLQEENKRLKTDLEEAGKREEQTRAELRRQHIALDRAQTELKATQKLIDEAVEKRRSDHDDAEGDEPGMENHSKALEFSEGGIVEAVQMSQTALLADLNRLFSGYSDQRIQIVECEQIAPPLLYNPVLSADRFLDGKAANLTPERLSLTAVDGILDITCFGGTFNRDGKTQEPIPEGWIPIASLPLYSNDEFLSPLICRFLEISLEDLTPVSMREEESQARPLHEKVMEQLNNLLASERGDRYRFRSIEAIEDGTLMNVELEQKGEVDSLENIVVAKTCEIRLIKKHKYLEFIFKQGFLLKDNQRQPFYEDQYRLPIPNIDTNQWIQAELDCLEVK